MSLWQSTYGVASCHKQADYVIRSITCAWRQDADDLDATLRQDSVIETPCFRSRTRLHRRPLAQSPLLRPLIKHVGRSHNWCKAELTAELVADIDYYQGLDYVPLISKASILSHNRKGPINNALIRKALINAILISRPNEQ